MAMLVQSPAMHGIKIDRVSYDSVYILRRSTAVSRMMTKQPHRVLHTELVFSLFTFSHRDRHFAEQ